MVCISFYVIEISVQLQLLVSVTLYNIVVKWGKWQTTSLESIQLEAAKKILGYSSKTFNAAVRGGIWGLESLKGRRDRCKLCGDIKLQFG